MKLFIEERALLGSMLQEWYEGMDGFSKAADGIFSEKGKMYDRESPVWERIRFPHGFVQELRKKTDRLTQLLSDYNEGGAAAAGGPQVNWDEVLEELRDIYNYSRMFGSLIEMSQQRAKIDPRVTLEVMVDRIKGWLQKGGK